MEILVPSHVGIHNVVKTIFKMWFFFEMCFHFQNVKGFMSVVFPFSKKHYTDRNNLVTLGIQVTQFLDLLFESTLVLVLSTENKTKLTN